MFFLFFYCSLPDINCSPFTVGKEVVLSFSQRRRSGRWTRDERRGRDTRKRSGFEPSCPLTGVKSSPSQDCTGGRLQKQTRSERKETKERRHRLSLKGESLAMATAVPPKKMVSSVFITLASPHRGTVTQQQQPTLQAHSSPVRDSQQTAVQISPANSVPTVAKKKDRSSTNGIRPQSKNESPVSPSVQVSVPSRVQPGSTPAKLYEKIQPTDSLPCPSLSAQPSSMRTTPLEEMSLPPPPPALEAPECPLTLGQQPIYSREVERSAPPCALNTNLKQEQIPKTNPDTSEVSKDVCGFCRKYVDLSEPAIEALNRTYHEACFQCRSCHIPLASKQYYNKAGIPLCEDCYQASLELCWACGEVIKHQVMRALERAYHPQCFTCTTCKEQIGEQRFAQGEVGEVYCLPDYYRKYAPKCNACNQLIIPKEDGTDSYTVECLGHSYHEDCYRCEMCFIHLTPEPSEHGCYPLDGKLLCKPCHLSLVSAQHGQ